MVISIDISGFTLLASKKINSWNDPKSISLWLCVLCEHQELILQMISEWKINLYVNVENPRLELDENKQNHVFL